MSILDMFRLDGKVALVTGGNRGIGFGIATGLAEAGADIVNVSRGEDAPELRETVTGLGRRFMHLQVDLGGLSAETAQPIIQACIEQMGSFDILVNNAGINRRSPALNFTEATWNEVLQVNLQATFLLSQAAARHMKGNGGGKIIQIASMLSFQGGWESGAYTASKHAVAGMTKSFANEWAQHNINVNAIAPGYFTTNLTSPLHQSNLRNKQIEARIPAGYWGDVQDLRGAAVLLASEAGRYMHGSIVVVDGGWLTR